MYPKDFLSKNVLDIIIYALKNYWKQNTTLWNLFNNIAIKIMFRKLSTDMKKYSRSFSVEKVGRVLNNNSRTK